jgi:hypothetical protein
VHTGYHAHNTDVGLCSIACCRSCCLLLTESSSCRLLSCACGAGYYAFGRSSGLNKETPPGTSRKGQFCAVSHIKALYTEAQIRSSFSVNTICNGESMRSSLSPVKP